MEDTFPHLDSLRQSALWLTLRGILAEELVMKTMTRSYREWHVSDDLVGNKVRLFRVLTREFFGFGRQGRQWYDSMPFRSEGSPTNASPDLRSPQTRMSTIEQSQLQTLNGIPCVLVKGAIAHLRPHSRLMLMLLYREQFSYADIGYITDLPMSSVKAALTRLREQLPRYILEFAGHFNGTTDNQPVVGTDTGESDRERQHVTHTLPFISPQVVRADTTAENWENEGGTVASQCRE